MLEMLADLEIQQSSTASDAGERASRSQTEAKRRASEVPSIPRPRDMAFRRECLGSLLFFLEHCFPGSTSIDPLSDDHKRIIAKIETLIRNGGRQANAVYRGFAKTTISELSTLWAGLTGLRRYAAMYGAEESQSSQMIDSIKRELTTNEILLETFPEICCPFVALDNKPQRCASQHYAGESTYIRMGADTLIFPCVKVGWENAGAGYVIKSRGIKSAARGAKVKHPKTGENVRPDLHVIDDPQTDESAEQPTEVERRLSILRKGIIKSTGHRSSAAVIVNGTVIQPNDFMDQLLDADQNPGWQADRIPMVKSWAVRHEEFWLAQYRTVRHSFDPSLPGDRDRAAKEATELYRQNREAADEGCVVSWEYCYDRENELSAIQHAYNLLVDDPADVFECEMQQSPPRLDETHEKPLILDEKSLATAIGRYQRGECPADTERVSAFIDVHDRLLFWCALAVSADYDVHCIDYGVWPEQPTPEQFTMARAPMTMAAALPHCDTTFERVASGIIHLADWLLSREWTSSVGSATTDRLHVDVGYLPKAVEYALKNSGHDSSRWRPARGISINASDQPMTLWSKRKGKTVRRLGQEWCEERKAGRTTAWVDVDVNTWKTRLHELAYHGRFHWFVPDENQQTHTLIAHHWHAEAAIRKRHKKTGFVVDEWAMAKEGRDNHWLDCCVGALVAANASGLKYSLESPDTRSAEADARWQAFMERRSQPQQAPTEEQKPTPPRIDADARWNAFMGGSR